MTQSNVELINIVISRFGMGGDVLLQQLQKIKESAFRDLSRLESQHPDWNRSGDARFRSIRKLINTVERTQFLVHIIGKLLDDEWSDTNLENETQRNQDYKRMLVVELEITTKYGFGMSFFTLIESYFRIFLRAMNPTACNNATDAFCNIYDSLLGPRHLNLTNNDRVAALELLDFIRHIRNLIHNGGVYFADDSLDKTVDYKGVSYTFRHSQAVDFVCWELLLNLAEDIRQLLVQVIRHPLIIQITTIID